MKPVWFDSYPAGVPHAIELPAHESLVTLIDTACRRFATRPAFANFGSGMNFADLDAHADRVTAALLHAFGLRPGDRVGLMMPNMLAYPVVLLAVLRAGGVVVNINPQYTARELRQVIDDADLSLLFVFENALSTVADAAADGAVPPLVVTRIGDLMNWPKSVLINRVARRDAAPPARALEITAFGELLRHERVTMADRPLRAGDDLAFLQYTGGTTGQAKGAMLTHRNVLANVLQVNAWFGPISEPGREVIITALPLYHIYALTANCLSFLSIGGLNYLITDPRNLNTFIREVRRTRFTAMTGVNTLFRALLEHPGFDRLDFGQLKLTSGGGMAVHRVVAERWQTVTGKAIAEGYGLTEASPVVTANRFDVDGFTGSIGLPVPSTEISLRDENNDEVASGEPGELCVRGPQVMQGYWRRPEETRATLDADGWLHTGDIATIDERGYLRIVDRKKDLVIVSGFNVYPNEIEDVVAAHNGVREVAAIGIPDARSGESLRLVVVRSAQGDDRHGLDEAALIDWCRERLAGYKVPRSVRFADELPKSNIGKVLRRAVREKWGAP